MARTLAALGARVIVAVVAAQGAEAAGEIMAPDGVARFVQTDIADEAFGRRLRWPGEGPLQLTHMDDESAIVGRTLWSDDTSPAAAPPT
ncbi:MAG: hypothetical protein IT318_01940 [Anaerolineales bacterium]|nr:hypothetical protein [Anaerolineales bacterium]